MRNVDVKNAYLHGVFQDEIFMQQPLTAFSVPRKEKLVCIVRLKRSFYGLEHYRG